MDDQLPLAAVRLRAARIRRGLERRDLAIKLRRVAASEGITLPKTSSLVRMIINWESGARPRPHYRRLIALALDMTAEQLFGAEPGAEHVRARELPAAGGRTGEVLELLNEQWYLLVRRDNLLGPRHTMTSVLEQLRLVEDLLATARGLDRLAVLHLGARYAESAAWLHEDAGAQRQARHWTDQAATWAYEGGDDLMLAWSMFRRSQHSTAAARAGDVIGQTAAALRHTASLPPAMQAALLQQQAQGYALDRQESVCMRLLDQARELAAHINDQGDARAGHGSFCTPAYLDVIRATCWMHLHDPGRAVNAYEEALPFLPPIYQRDRGIALAGLAAAYAANHQPEQAAEHAQQAMVIATDSGSERITQILNTVGRALLPHHTFPAVADFQRALPQRARH